MVLVSEPQFIVYIFTIVTIVVLKLIPFFLQVNFPSNGSIHMDKLGLLEKLLPPRPEVDITDDMEQVDLVDFDPQQSRHRYNGEAYHDEEDDHPRSGVQCQTS